jgi:hypothetical protein
MPALPKALEGVDLKNLAKLLGISTVLGIPAGALSYLARDYVSPEPQIPSATSFTDLPLYETAGPERVVEKSSGIIDKLRNAYGAASARYHDISPFQRVLAIGAGGSVGAGIGYGTTGSHMQRKERDELDKQLAERQELFNKLLLQEQMDAAGVKSAEVLDAALDTIFEAAFEKSAKGGKADIAELAKTELFPTLMALVGVGYGFNKGWGNTVATDKNRAVAEALRSSLDERLMGNPEGPRAPMIVKVKTNRIGASPISGGGSKSTSRDVLGRL